MAEQLQSKVHILELYRAAKECGVNDRSPGFI
jgi:hypothetical protein